MEDLKFWSFIITVESLYFGLARIDLVKCPLYMEITSFQGVGMEEFHCIQRCPHFRELE